MKEKIIPIKNVVEELKRLNIRNGDTIMIHSAFSCIRNMEKGAEGVILAFEEVVGPTGTIVMPVFNWDILHQGDEIIYDVRKTPSKMGYLTEYFRTRNGTVITKNLFNPLAVKGRLADNMLKCPCESSWGQDSPFQILYDENALVLMIGVDYNTVTMFHIAETMFGVSYRFVYEFPNSFFIDKSGNKEPLKNTTLRRYDGYPTDFNVVDELFKRRGLVKEIEIGDSITRLIDSHSLVECVIEELTKNGEFLIQKSVPRQWVATRRKGVFYSKDFIYELWLKNRNLLSDGYDRSLKKIEEYIPLKINSFPSGMQVWDWTIPERWENHGGKILSLEGEVIFDLKEHPLHIAPGSVPFEGKIGKEELFKHIKVDKTRPDVIPYCTLHYDNDWAICLPYNSLKKLAADSFKVELSCEKTNGDLKIGECTLKGASSDSIIIPLHLDHPGQCNDNLSGIATAIAIIQKLMKMKRRLRHTIRFVFLAETIGIVTFLSQNEKLISHLKWGIVFDSIGTTDELMFMRSKKGNTRLDICTELAFKSHAKKYSEFSFLEIEGYGNDERILQAPGIGIPSVSISRFPYKEYHSSLDTPDIISSVSLKEVEILVFELIRMLDLDFIPIRNYSGIPQLSKMENLKKEFLKDARTKRAIHRFFFLIDGERSVSEIALETGVTFDFAYNFFSQLKDHDKIDSKSY